MKNKLVLKFPKSLLDKPILNTVVKKFDLDFNILHAQVNPKAILILELEGTDSNYKGGIDYLKELKVDVQPLSKDITTVSYTHLTLPTTPYV